MGKALGLDLGTNSIGWALSQDDELLACGIRVFPTAFNDKRLEQRQKRRLSQRTRLGSLKTVTEPRKEFSIISVLWLLTGATFFLVLLNRENWQFWLNISLTILLTTLTLVHQNKNK